MTLQKIRSRPPRDERQLCRCSTCMAQDPQGRWYSRSTVWRHARSNAQIMCDWALLTWRDCAEEHQVLAEEIDAPRRDARSQRPTDSFSRPEARTQDIAYFFLVVNEQVCLKYEPRTANARSGKYRKTSQRITQTMRWNLTATAGLMNLNRVFSTNFIWTARWLVSPIWL